MTRRLSHRFFSSPIEGLLVVLTRMSVVLAQKKVRVVSRAHEKDAFLENPICSINLVDLLTRYALVRYLLLHDTYYLGRQG